MFDLDISQQRHIWYLFVNGWLANGLIDPGVAYNLISQTIDLIKVERLLWIPKSERTVSQICDRLVFFLNSSYLNAN